MHWRRTKKDETSDEDGDGIPDVLQISQREKIQRKGLMLLRVVKPEKVTRAITCLNTGLLAVLASLKMTFARAVTLGASLSEFAKVRVDKSVVPYISNATPEAYRQWIPPVIDYLCKIIAVSIAFTLQRFISAFYSALKGGQLLGVGIVRFLNSKGFIKEHEDETNLDEAIGYGAAFLGFMFQFWNGFSLFFPLNLLFLPATMTEGTLSIAVNWF